MTLPVVVVTSGGIAISQAANGLPVALAANGFGLAVMPVASGGMPVTVTSGSIFGPPVAPANTGLPVISGLTQVGQTLYTTAGTWSGTAATYTFQWKRGGVNIAGATGGSYLLVTADLAANITVTVTATNPAGSASATSAARGPVTVAAPANSVPPVITGSTVEGGVLTTTTGTWSGSPTYAYQWKRAGTNVGTNANTYTTVSGDVGSTINCLVTATNAGGSASAGSNSLGPITAVAPGTLGIPTLSWESMPTINPPLLYISLPAGVVAGDHIIIQKSTDAVTWTAYTDIVVTDPDAGAASGTAAALPTGAYVLRARMERGAAFSDWGVETNINLVADVTAPTVVSYNPTDNSVIVPLNAELIVTFSESIVFGTSGTVSLKKTSDNSTIYSWDVATNVGSTAGKLEILNYAELHLHLSTNLVAGVECYVVWTAGVVKDRAGNGVAAQSSTTAWSFSGVVPSLWVPNTTAVVNNIAYSSPTVTFNLTLTTAATDTVIVMFSNNAQPTSSLTVKINGTNMTPAVTSSGGGGVGIYYIVGAYTNPTVVITSSVNVFQYVGFSYGKWIGASAVPGATTSIPVGYYPDPTLFGSLTVPSGGALLALCAAPIVSGITWDNITSDASAYDATGFGHSMAHHSTPGPIVVSQSGTNYAGSATAAITMGP